MPVKLQEQMQRMSGLFVTMQDTITQQLRALREVQGPLTPEVLRHIEQLDQEIDQNERLLEQEALRLLALQAPVAQDLRQVLMMIQSSPDLERAGDHAKHLARFLLDHRSAWPGDTQLPALLQTLEKMSGKLRSASFPLDGELARQVIALDDQIDQLYDEVQEQLLRVKPLESEVLAHVHAAQLWRAAERLGDHLKNVASRIVRVVA